MTAGERPASSAAPRPSPPPFKIEVPVLRPGEGINRMPRSAVRVREIHLSTALELFDVLNPMNGFYRAGSIFRGQSDSTWPLLPAAFRKGVPELLPSDRFPRSVYAGQVKQEIESLYLFVARANEAGLAIPDRPEHVRELVESIRSDGWWVASQKNLRSWPPRDLVPALALAQHHGVATRLLDWTYSGLVAAYFAAEDAARNGRVGGELAVWTCQLADDRRSVAGAPSVSIERPAAASNANLRAQRGCLMVWRWGGTANAPFEVAGFEKRLSEAADRAGVCGSAIFDKVTIPQTEAGSLLQLLSWNQVDGGSLFPGYDGIAKTVRERAYWPGVQGHSASYEAQTERRFRELRDRLPAIPLLVWDNEEDLRDDSEFGRLRASLAAVNRMLDAGDYDPRLEARIKQYEEIHSSVKPQNPLVAREISDLLGRLRAQL